MGNRGKKVKIVMDICDANKLNKGTMTVLLALTSDKGLTKLIAELRENFPESLVN